MHDDLKPRRSRSEEQAEITSAIARAQADADAPRIQALQNPPLWLLVEEREEAEEGASRRREAAETIREREEAECLLATEAEIAAEIPTCRARELARTFPLEFGSGRRSHSLTAV